MLFLYRSFFGILEIEIYGIYPEKVLNICEKNRISLWDIHIKKGKICCKIKVSDYKKMPRLFKRQGVRLHILSRKGLPFFTNRYKRRFGAVLGVAVFFLLLFYLSSFVWIIDINGNKTVTDAEITALCEQIGIKEGMKSKNFDAKIKAQELLLKSNKLSWASFNIEGCVLSVNVTEIDKKKEDDLAPCNLVASSDGIIKHIDVTVGNCVVKVGDTVRRGDVLVSGIIENENGTKFVKSRGSIIAKTINTAELFQPYKFRESYLTGKQKTKRVLDIFTLKIPLFLGKEKSDYDSVYKAENLELFGKKIPIKIHTRHFIFKENESVKIDYTSACERLSKSIKKQYPNAVIREEYFDNYTGALLKATIYEEYDITESQKIIIDNNFPIEKRHTP